MVAMDPMVRRSFQTKNSDLGIFWRTLEWKRLVYSMVIGYILRIHFVHFMAFGNFVVIWYTFPRFGISCQEKSGTPNIFS
jgi:hypothetical protein